MVYVSKEDVLNKKYKYNCAVLSSYPRSSHSCVFWEDGDEKEICQFSKVSSLSNLGESRKAINSITIIV